MKSFAGIDDVCQPTEERSTRYELISLDQAPGPVRWHEYGASTLPPRFTTSEKEWMIVLIEQGEGVSIGGTCYALEPGDIIVLPPRNLITFSTSQPTLHGHVCRFELKSLEGRSMAIPHRARLPLGKVTEVCGQFQKNAAHEGGLVAHIWCVLWQRSKDATVYRQHALLYDAERFITTHLSEDISISQICDALKVSPRTLLAVFQEEHHSTIQNFIVKKKVQEATSLLICSDLTVQAVSEAVGYADVRYFRKLVKQHTGRSPSEIRDALQAEPKPQANGSSEGPFTCDHSATA